MKPSDPALEALWKHVLDHWDNDAAHRAFLDHCQNAGALDQAAVRYRGMTGDRVRRPAAERHLGHVLVLALSKLEVSRAEPEAASSRATKLMLIAFFLIGSLIILAYLLRT